MNVANVNPFTKLDHDVLHRILWRRVDRRGRLRVVAKDLAAELGITPFTFSRVMSRMVVDGRLHDLGRDDGNYKLWTVVDPELWQPPGG